ncbi:AMP-dependent synthetase/ligase [Limnobacter humi]|uniref:AMP-dependent synthetase/ligase n=1 Tax=Limnobacter humi TaxID=1778671 RepID=A0ABT1WEV1_9BURK|nr:AMP-dependent synthetase/ligase [Limnobacter humi]MCQ8896051.1 AMP-dependent synthetase/ligase [Limnobacter humi]
MANVATFLQQHDTSPNRVLYRQFIDNEWVDFKASEMIDLARNWQSFFRSMGLQPGDRVAICLKNSIHWVAFDLAALAMGMVSVPLYVDDNAGNICYCIQNSGARAVVVENDRIGRNLLKEGLQDVRVLSMKSDIAVSEGGVDNALHLLKSLERQLEPLELLDLPPDTLATICYTSGTSGRPKGVMLSHNNMISNVDSCFQLDIAKPEDTFLSFLPMSHMFERTGGYYLPLRVGAKVIYARGINQLPEDLATQAPTVLFAVPRIFEKFYGRIQASVKDSSFKRRAFEKLVDVGWRMAQGKGGIMDHFQLPLLRAKVAQPILERLGGRLRLAVVGGAALDSTIAKSFIAMGLPILHGYGMTEACPVISVNRPESNVPESVGPPLPNVKVKLGDNDELLAKGPNIMLGYWENDEATRQAIDKDGWLHTGDVAEIKDGRIFIRGRIKDIMVLSNGEKFSPQDAETAIIGDDVFEQIVLVGEGRPFISMIAVTANSNEKELIKRANDRLGHLPRYIRVRRIITTKEPWTVDNGLLTPTLKVKRVKVLDAFKERIDDLYSEGMGD